MAVVDGSEQRVAERSVKSIVVRCALFATVMLAAFAAAQVFVRVQPAPLDGGAAAADLSSRAAFPSQAVAVAAVVCGLSGLAGLVVTLVWRGTAHGVAAALGGSFLGMVLPLATGIVLQRRGGELQGAGVFGWIVLFYLVALAAKTLLATVGFAAQAKTARPFGAARLADLASGSTSATGV